MSKKVAVITGFHKSTEFLKILFKYLNNQTYKNFQLYVYSSSDAEFDCPENLDFKYSFVKLKQNAGFAGGNNAAILYAKQEFEYDYYALINDDTKPHEDWLKYLVQSAESNHKAGVISSKMLYYEKFITISGVTTTSSRNDSRELGVRFYSNSKFKECYYPKKFFADGFYSNEEDEINEFNWTSSNFKISLPVVIKKLGATYSLDLFLRKNQYLSQQFVEIKMGVDYSKRIELFDHQLNYSISIPSRIIEKNAHYVIQNAGSAYDKVFNGYDIGSGEIDNGQYEKPKQIDMFCGGSCLFTKQALEKTGLFNAYYFCYYEDSDLSLRMRKNGFQINYAPKSLIYHYHAASGKEWSSFFTYHVFRNKIIFAAKNFGFKAFIVAFKERYKETILFYKLSSKSKFKNRYYNQRLKLNLVILKDALKGIMKYNPTKF